MAWVLQHRAVEAPEHGSGVGPHAGFTEETPHKECLGNPGPLHFDLHQRWFCVQLAEQSRLCFGFAGLGGSWVVISRVISRITVLITHIRGLITLLITAHEPPSGLGECVAQDLAGRVERIDERGSGLGFRV